MIPWSINNSFDMYCVLLIIMSEVITSYICHHECEQRYWDTSNIHNVRYKSNYHFVIALIGP